MCALVTGVQTCALPIFGFARAQCPTGLLHAGTVSDDQQKLYKARRVLDPKVELDLGVAGLENARALGVGLHARIRLEHERHRNRGKSVDFDDAAFLDRLVAVDVAALELATLVNRSEEHTSELQSLMRISYAFFCLKKTIHTTKT